MHGFIYIWRDRKRNRYYIGSHWGEEDDGYIGSSSWLKAAIKRRPNDFKRRIIERLWFNGGELLKAEQRWLDQIKEEELGKHYYNLKKRAAGGMGPAAAKLVGERMRGRKLTEKQKAKQSAALTGKPWSQKRRKAQTGNYTQTLMYEHKGKILGTIKNAVAQSGLCKATINRYCDPSGTYAKSEWRKFNV